jgi:hypothetical protein
MWQHSPGLLGIALMQRVQQLLTLINDHRDRVGCQSLLRHRLPPPCRTNRPRALPRRRRPRIPAPGPVERRSTPLGPLASPSSPAHLRPHRHRRPTTQTKARPARPPVQPAQSPCEAGCGTLTRAPTSWTPNRPWTGPSVLRSSSTIFAVLAVIVVHPARGSLLRRVMLSRRSSLLLPPTSARRSTISRATLIGCTR